ncbi:hypothetical protein [Demequina sediminicola]|uniref:hypothetical protein n=1 Tax=Demequina sediminicola TaxID=1095026 RepID=UPI00078451FC|nr:hypothetical protein [Demequina sediminicola]
MSDANVAMLDEAIAAASRAGVTVRELSTVEVDAAATLLRVMWGSGVVEPPMMVALRHAGAYVAGAFSDNRLVAVCVAYFAEPLGKVLHSHVAAVAPGNGHRGIGMALKLHQRAWAGVRGLRWITWTFDPLVARNASFNLNRLRVEVAEYLVDFYGQMPDAVNAGQGSDRLLARWDVASTHGEAVSGSQGLSVRVAQAAPLLVAGPDEKPVLTPLDADVSLITVAVPADIEAMRRENSTVATHWRHAVREALQDRIVLGWTIIGFEGNRYVLEAP